jgi:DNA polymerase III epsilon subunit-like protein
MPDSEQLFLVIDTETNGLPPDFRAAYSNVSNWPRMVQLAWGLYDSRGTRVGRNVCIVKPDGFRISDVSVHGISQERANREGLPINDAVQPLLDVVSRHRPVLVAHNVSFDFNVVACELYRLGLHHDFVRLTRLCTMESSTNYCRLPSRRAGSYKWPSLVEMHKHLFGSALDSHHDAGADMDACARSFFRLGELGVINLSSYGVPPAGQSWWSRLTGRS